MSTHIQLKCFTRIRPLTINVCVVHQCPQLELSVGAGGDGHVGVVGEFGVRGTEAEATHGFVMWQVDARVEKKPA